MLARAGRATTRRNGGAEPPGARHAGSHGTRTPTGHPRPFIRLSILRTNDRRRAIPAGPTARDRPAGRLARRNRPPAPGDNIKGIMLSAVAINPESVPWALGELRNFVTLTQSRANGGLFFGGEKPPSQANAGDIAAAAHTVEAILERVLPDWRTTVPASNSRRWAQH